MAKKKAPLARFFEEKRGIITPAPIRVVGDQEKLVVMVQRETSRRQTSYPRIRIRTARKKRKTRCR